MLELTWIAENEVRRRENATVETGSFAVDALETAVEDHVVWGPDKTGWLGFTVGSARVVLGSLKTGHPTALNLGSRAVGTTPINPV